MLKGLPAFEVTNMGKKMYVLVFVLQGGVPASQHERGSVVYHQLRAHNHNRVCKSDCKHTNTTSRPDKLQSTKWKFILRFA